MILMMSNGLMNHVILIPILLGVSGRDSWIAALADIPPLLVWLGMLTWFLRAKGERPLFEWILSSMGRPVAIFVTSLTGIYILISAYFTLNETINWTVASYLPETSQFLLALGLVLVSAITAKYGLQTIAIVAGILLPVVVLLGFFVAGSNIPNKDYARLFPLFETGLSPLWRGMTFSGAAFMELFSILLISEHVSSKIKFRHMAVIGLIMVGLTVGPLTAGIAEFGSIEAARLRYPAFEEWKLVSFRRYLEHLDTLSIYQWLTGAFIRIAFALYLICNLIHARKPRLTNALLAVLSAVLVVGTLIPLSDYKELWLFAHVTFPASFVLLLALTAFFTCLSLMNGKERDVRER